MNEIEGNLNEQEVQLVIFRMHQEEFGVVIQRVLEIVPLLEITKLPNANRNFIIGVINLRGQIIPVFDLARQLDLPAASLSKASRIVVIEVNKNKVGMLVDEVPEVLKVVASTIEATPDLIKKRMESDFISGVAKVDHRLIVVLDFSKIDLLTPKKVQLEGAVHG